MESGFAGLQFGAGILIDPHFVADGHGTILGGISPIALTTRLQRYGSFYDTDAGDTCGRVFFLVAGTRLRRKQNQKTSNTQQKPKLASAGKSGRLHDQSPVFGRDVRLATGPCWKGPSDGSRMRLASSRLNPRTGKKLPFPHGIGTSCRAGANHKTCASVQRVPTVLGAEPWQVNGACSRRDKSSDNSACY